MAGTCWPISIWWRIRSFGKLADKLGPWICMIVRVSLWHLGCYLGTPPAAHKVAWRLFATPLPSDTPPAPTQGCPDTVCHSPSLRYSSSTIQGDPNIVCHSPSIRYPSSTIQGDPEIICHSPFIRYSSSTIQGELCHSSSLRYSSSTIQGYPKIIFHCPYLDTTPVPPQVTRPLFANPPARLRQRFDTPPRTRTHCPEFEPSALKWNSKAITAYFSNYAPIYFR